VHATQREPLPCTRACSSAFAFSHASPAPQHSRRGTDTIQPSVPSEIEAVADLQERLEIDGQDIRRICLFPGPDCDHGRWTQLCKGQVLHSRMPLLRRAVVITAKARPVLPGRRKPRLVLPSMPRLHTAQNNLGSKLESHLEECRDVQRHVVEDLVHRRHAGGSLVPPPPPVDLLLKRGDRKWSVKRRLGCELHAEGPCPDAPEVTSPLVLMR